MKQATQELQTIYKRLIEIEDDPHPDFDDIMSELRTLEEKADSLSDVLDIHGRNNIRDLVRLYDKIMKKISELRYDLSGYNPKVEMRRMFPNIEDYNDYCDGEY